MSGYVLLGGFLIAVAVGWIVGVIIHLVVEERRIVAAEKDWRDWFDSLPVDRQREGAERLWAAVSETPLYDATVADVFRQQLDTFDGDLNDWTTS